MKEEKMEIGKREIAPDAKMPVITLRVNEDDDAHQVKRRVKNWLALGGRGIEIDGQKPAVKKHVAEAIKEFNKNSKIDRKDLFLTATVPNCNHKAVTNKFKQDLRTLDTEYVDLLLLDHVVGNCSLAWSEMETIYTSKQARAIGVKNAGMKHLEDIVANAEVNPHVGQLGLNVFKTSHKITNFLAENKIEIQSNTPFGGDPSSANNNTDYLSLISENEDIKKIAKAHNVSAFQIAMKWILRHKWSLSFNEPLNLLHKNKFPEMHSFKLTHPEMVSLNQLPKSSAQQHPDGQNGKHPNGQHPNGQHPNSQDSKHPNGQNGQHPNGQNGKHPNGQNGKHPNAQHSKLEIDTRAIADGVQMPVISADFNNLLDKKSVENKMKHWINIGGTGFYVSDNIKMVGDALQDEIEKNSIERKNIFLTMKVNNCDQTAVINKVETNLQKLGTDYVDLLLLQHSHKGDCNLAWNKMKQLLNKNETRAIGISHFPIKPLKTFLNNEKAKKPDVYQGTFNIFDPHFAMLRTLQNHTDGEDIKVLSDSPFGGDSDDYDPTLISENPLIAKIAEDRGVTAFQVAMKWVLQHKMLLSFPEKHNIDLTQKSVIVDMSSFTLSTKEMKELNQVFKNHDNDLNNNKQSSNVGTAIGISAMIVLILLLVGAAFVIVRRKRYRQRKERSLPPDGIFKDNVENIHKGEYRDEPVGAAAAEEGVGYEDDTPEKEMAEVPVETTSNDIC